ncbi:MAG: hypothetical protein JW942_08405 [Opitutales bacterium]|nr:hypothetical protein [Opitutales bacterium]
MRWKHIALYASAPALAFSILGISWFLSEKEISHAKDLSHEPASQTTDTTDAAASQPHTEDTYEAYPPLQSGSNEYDENLTKDEKWIKGLLDRNDIGPIAMNAALQLAGRRAGPEEWEQLAADYQYHIHALNVDDKHGDGSYSCILTSEKIPHKYSDGHPVFEFDNSTLHLNIITINVQPDGTIITGYKAALSRTFHIQ